jgi:hypothetical protein
MRTTKNKHLKILFALGFLCLLGIIGLVTLGIKSQQEGKEFVFGEPVSGLVDRVASILPFASPKFEVHLQAANGKTIEFRTQNDRTIQGVPPQTRQVPHLVLFRNGELTEPDERTLVVKVGRLNVPNPGITVNLRVETQNWDPDLNNRINRRILVWEESRWIPNSERAPQKDVEVEFSHVFTDTIRTGSGLVQTPTDYFQYKVEVGMGDTKKGSSPQPVREEYSFLMENQWIAPLPSFRAQDRDHAPERLILYTCDMFPFERDGFDLRTRLKRSQVGLFIQDELLPEMVAGIAEQTDEWGFSWSPQWTSYRPEDGDRQLSVALAQNAVWYHGKSPSTAHSGISINVQSKDLAAYSSLKTGILSAFHHELFHNIQRGLNQQVGGVGNVDGIGERWEFVTEGTSVLASMVAQPEAELAREARTSYLSQANTFLAGDQFYSDDLNTSYETINPYHSVLYWRFLYEQCGGMDEEIEGLTNGMRVIYRTLNALYARENGEESDLSFIEELPEVMNDVLSGEPSCPFHSYRESLVAFSQAIYALRLEGGRCTQPGKPSGCGFYDPKAAYADPPVERVIFTGKDRVVSGAIASSFGMDFIEVVLRPGLDQRSLTVEFSTTPGSRATFKVQIWKLLEDKNRLYPETSSSGWVDPEVFSLSEPAVDFHYDIPVIGMQAFNRLGLIITRIDSSEKLDSTGSYTIKIQSNGEVQAGSTGDGSIAVSHSSP